MGRHRRVGAEGAADEQHPAGPATSRGARSHRRMKRASTPVRTGLLGASAAVAMGAVAVASGLIPGTDNYSGGKDAGKVQSAGSPTELQTQSEASKSPDREESAASRDSARPEPSSSAPSRSAEPSESPTPEKSSASSAPDKAKGDGNDADKDTGKTESAKPEKPAAPQSPDTAKAAEAEVLSLVNQERIKAGCGPVRQDGDLAELAGDFSKDMAARGFFDHTDPDGDTPWDRADKAGITNLGGENIARGQANAQSVMDSWMKSPGHRANILNCDYKTLGVGAHFASGGPWWTQDFGF
ncbi:CAP domain-containing protein [Streptomyces monticola]|uniref:CAP domain-containing protein n=1 Tax=Streptomyces monticola TaxID=2666263 RepID=A0ABW2JT25_9ACTN